MKLVIIPDVDGPSMAIIDENFPPENYVDIDRDILDLYKAREVIDMLIQFNQHEYP